MARALRWAPPLAICFLTGSASAPGATPPAAFAQTGSISRFDVHIREASGRYDVPEAWIRRVMAAESGGRTMLDGKPIRSIRGAIGLMQLMPATWEAMRRAHDLGGDPDDPRDNILAGTAYLRSMYDRFGYPGCIAAYNAGPARYAAYLASGRALPAETIAYLGAVTGMPTPRGAAAARDGVDPAREPLFALRRGAALTENADGSSAQSGTSMPALFAVRRPQ